VRRSLGLSVDTTPEDAAWEELEAVQKDIKAEQRGETR
jgi:hypothetical protein